MDDWTAAFQALESVARCIMGAADNTGDLAPCMFTPGPGKEPENIYLDPAAQDIGQRPVESHAGVNAQY